MRAVAEMLELEVVKALVRFFEIGDDLGRQICVVDRSAVDTELIVGHRDSVTRQADHSLDEAFAVGRREEHDQVAAPGLRPGP